jgi:hypothetical protein
MSTKHDGLWMHSGEDFRANCASEMRPLLQRRRRWTRPQRRRDLSFFLTATETVAMICRKTRWSVRGAHEPSWLAKHAAARREMDRRMLSGRAGFTRELIGLGTQTARSRPCTVDAGAERCARGRREPAERRIDASR